MKTSLLIVILMLMIGLYSCSKEETVVSSSSDTLSYSFNNLNDSIITIDYAIGGSTSSQPKSYSVNLMKNPLNIRFNSRYISSGAGSSMMVQLSYETSTDTLRRQAFTMSTVKDSLRLNITGPANKLNLTPTNFKGRGTITVFK